MASTELCAGVDATRAGVPVQQHLAELAVRGSQQHQGTHAPADASATAAAAAAAAAAIDMAGGARSYPRPDPAAVPKGPPPTEYN